MDFDDDEFDGLDDDYDDGASDETWDVRQPCPECGAEIYEDSVRCPACGAYVSWDQGVGGRSPRWDRLVKLGLVLLLLGVVGSTVISLLLAWSRG